MVASRDHAKLDLGAEARRTFDDIRSSFDLPFVPGVFRSLAAHPQYLQMMWDDLGPVARSREFQAASRALEEFVKSHVISGGWRFSDQARALASQKFSSNDIEQLAAVVATMTRAAARMTLFTLLMQRGYSGGQKGRTTPGKQASALSRMITLHIPAEKEAGMRAWLIYGDIRRTLGTRHVMSFFRILSPYPGYLGSVWMDTKRMLNDPSYLRARDEVVKRSRGLITGLPVRDHRIATRGAEGFDWRGIEETVDNFVRSMPPATLITATWQRSFDARHQVVAA